MKKKSLFLLLASVLSLASCGKKENKTVTTAGSVDRVLLNQTSIEVQEGKRSTDVTVTLEGTGDYNKNVKLVSENEAVAKASFTQVESGETFKVYGIAAGTTNINLVSLQDESKATSLSVSVKSKEEIPGVSEIVSVSLSKETHLFHESDTPLEVTASLVGKGTFDDSISLTLSENPAVSLSANKVKSGEKFSITPTSVSNGGNTTIKASSIQDPHKYAELVVRVDEDIEIIDPASDLTLNARARTLTEGGASFVVSATTSAGDVSWSWKESDATEYVDFDGTPTGDSAKVKPIKATPDDKRVTLVASVGDIKAECRFSVAEKVKEYRTYYLSNNTYLSYSKVFFYAWGENGEENATYPGEELTTIVKNTLNEDCYEFNVDIAKYVGFKFSDGTKQTPDAYFSSFGSNNNVWYDDNGAHFAQIEKDEPNVSFHSNSVSIYNGEAASSFGFDVRKGDAEYEVTTGEGTIINVTDFANGSISIEGVAIGHATIRVYIPDTDAEDFLYVEVLDASDVKTLYFSNNKGWSKVFLYAWKNLEDNKKEEITTWPGKQLVNPIKNKEGEDVYVVHVPNKYDQIILNNGEGAQTVDISLNNSQFETKDNVYLLDTTDDSGHYNIGFANYEGFAYSVVFGLENVDVYSDKNVSVRVTANGSGVAYNIKEGSDVVQLVETADDHIVIKWLKAGSAKIVASFNGASDELVVTAKEGTAPDTEKTIYFTNNNGWSKVYLYAWGPTTSTSFPGEEIKDPLMNTSYQDVYVLKIDTYYYDEFVVSDGGSNQTVDISLSDPGFDSHNNIYISGESGGKYTVAFAEFAQHSHSYDSNTHLCECGRNDPEYPSITFTCNYDTGSGGTLYTVFFDDPNPQVWLEMTWYDGNNWSVTTNRFKAGTTVKFKVVKSYGIGQETYEGGSDRVWEIPHHAETYVCNWQA